MYPLYFKVPVRELSDGISPVRIPNFRHYLLVKRCVLNRDHKEVGPGFMPTCRDIGQDHAIGILAFIYLYKIDLRSTKILDPSLGSYLFQIPQIL